MRSGFRLPELSLRVRLLVLLVVLATVGLAVADVVSYRALHNYLYTRIDQQLESAVVPVSVQLSHRAGIERGPLLPGGAGGTEPGGAAGPRSGFGGPGGPGPAPDGHELPLSVFGQLRSADGEVLRHTNLGFGGDKLPLPALPGDLRATSLAAISPITVGQRGGGSEQFRVAEVRMANGTSTVVAVPLGDTAATLNHLAVIELIVSAAILLALALAAWWLVGVGLRPLRRMGEVAGDIAAGDLSRRVEPANGRTEVGRLGTSLNAMLEQIEAAFAEREASEARLRQFLADASHELRTPLASIRGYSELYRIGAGREPEQVERAMGRIESESERMAGLVDDLLALARIDEMREPARERIDLRALLADARDDARASAPGREVTLAAADADVSGNRPDGGEPKPMPPAGRTPAPRSGSTPTRTRCAASSPTCCATPPSTPRPGRRSRSPWRRGRGARRSPSATTAPASRPATRAPSSSASGAAAAPRAAARTAAPGSAWRSSPPSSAPTAVRSTPPTRPTAAPSSRCACRSPRRSALDPPERRAVPDRSQGHPRIGGHDRSMESATNHPTAPTTHDLGGRFAGRGGSVGARLRALPLPRPELAALLLLAALLNLWALSKNGFANDYYSAAVRSMSGSWHDFLFGSFDAKGLMTVDKPPLALWVQALSVKAFGFNSLAILVPQALMGVASVGLLYDLTRRRWGRSAGAVAGLALALTPVFVAVSRHNNPDALLVLCSVGALWCFLRALEDGSTKWLALAGVAVGLGFEAKMGAALMVVPGMALAWLWVAPRGRWTAVRQLAVAGTALLLVALAWPLVVWLTPASSRPWISGTSDNSIWSLIWEYNGFGRLEGQTGGPGGGMGGGGFFGGETGPLRLLNEALGGQAGWTLGLAALGGLGIAALSRLRRADPRTGWIIAVGGAFAVTAVAFSFAGGIFHPYYVSLLAPFAAALVGATFAQARSAGRPSRILGALAIAAGAVTEIAVIGTGAGELDWLVAPIIVVSIAAALVVLLDPAALLRRTRGSVEGDGDATGVDRARAWLALGNRRVTVALVSAFAVLLIAPAIWSVDTLGHPTSSTFPAGGPETAMTGGPGGGFGVGGTGGNASGGLRLGGGPGGLNTEGGLSGMGGEMGGTPGGEFGAPLSGGTEGVPGGGEMPSAGMLGAGEMPPGVGGAAMGAEAGAEGFSGPPSLGAEGSSAAPGAGTTGSEAGLPSKAGGGAIGGGMFGGEDLTSVLEYTEANGGGTIAVASQSGAASSIIESGAEVAGIGGFSGKESSVSVSWLREEIAAGNIRWILTGGGLAGGPGSGIGGDTRTGSEEAITTVVKSCEKVPASNYESAGSTSGAEAGTSASATSSQTLYDCGS
jgi:4-amino-4-deoxy-L-arabinose transferase-like glycosyltransferase/signal transduction histidine kinase